MLVDNADCLTSASATTICHLPYCKHKVLELSSDEAIEEVLCTFIRRKK